MWIIVILWGLLILGGCEYRRIADLQPFSKDNALVLKGICAIEIVIGHLGIATGSIALFPNRKAGILFVGIFFALSGYGLMYSVINKPGYLENFLRKRLPKILVPAYAIYTIGILMRCIAQKDGGILYRLISLPEIFEGINWYVWEIVALYVVFYICAKAGDIRKTHWWMLFITLIFILLAFVLGIDNPWYGSTLCFWLGIVYFLKQNSFREMFVERHMVLCLLVGSIIVMGAVVLFFVLGDNSFLGNVVGRNLASFFFVVCVIILLYRFKIGNYVSRFLGKYSYEIFLVHPTVISLLRSYIQNDLLYSACVLVVSVAFAIVYRECANIINKRG